LNGFCFHKKNHDCSHGGSCRKPRFFRVRNDHKHYQILMQFINLDKKCSRRMKMDKKFKSTALAIIAIIIVSACIPAVPSEVAAVDDVENSVSSAVGSSSEGVNNIPIAIGDGSFTIVDTGPDHLV